MFFSVLIPVYNVEKYLRESVDSVLNQDEQDFEIVLVDDGSTDSSGEICDEYAAKYPEKIRVIHKSNEGLLLTRRRAIRESTGDWIVHLDSDDYMLPGALSAIKNAAITNHADLVIYKIIYGQHDLNDMSVESKLPFRDGQLFAGDLYPLKMQLLAGGYMTAIYQKAAKREIVDVSCDYSKWKNVSLSEDYLQSLPLLNNASKAVYLDRANIYYRYNESSITKKKGYASYEANFWSKFTVFSVEKEYREKWNLTAAENGRICAKHIRELCLIIGQMAKSCCAEDVKKFRNFLHILSKQEDWVSDFSTASRKAIGLISCMCYYLIALCSVTGIKLLYKFLSK